MGEQGDGIINRSHYTRGITHCSPHGNKMPCIRCGVNIMKAIENDDLDDIEDYIDND
jgi:hypothetical protein